MSRPTRLEDVRAYPLQWPEERPRTPPRQRRLSEWNVGTFAGAVQDLQVELQRATIHNWILSTDVRPHSRPTDAEDPACALWFNQHVRGRWVLSVLACDRYQKVFGNVKAIAMTVQRLRLIDQYGCYSVSQAIEGAAYLALPGPETPAARPWREVLKVDGLEPSSIVDIDAHYRFLARRFASEGNQAAMVELNVARDAGKKELNAHAPTPTNS